MLFASSLLGDQIPARQTEGLTHGFLVLRDSDDNILASGEFSQVAHGDRITSNLVFNFKDGSIHQETTVFSERRNFRILTYHLVQKGKAFKRSTDLTLNGATGKITVVSADEKGRQDSISERLDLPNDLANGLLYNLLPDIDPKTPKTTVSMVVATPKPRLVKLEISPEGDDSFSIAGQTHKATCYVIKIHMGGVSGVVAPVVGKQPPDTHVWMVEGKAPSVVKLEGPLYESGPVWRIELASPVWH